MALNKTVCLLHTKSPLTLPLWKQSHIRQKCLLPFQLWFNPGRYWAKQINTTLNIGSKLLICAKLSTVLSRSAQHHYESNSWHLIFKPILWTIKAFPNHGSVLKIAYISYFLRSICSWFSACGWYPKHFFHRLYSSPHPHIYFTFLSLHYLFFFFFLISLTCSHFISILSLLGWLTVRHLYIVGW